ncbi:MAG TPA: deoxyribodipyrimidine photo-lyase [Acidimicrobiales bacterium]|nr:deoxyribodipyrimidine photo-lyase [Acidimicrobiales bacterium]
MPNLQPGQLRTAVMWFRRDLRVGDHPALRSALDGFDRVVPLFVWDPALTVTSGPNRLAFLEGCLRSLDQDLSARLVVRSGDPVRMVLEAAREGAAAAVMISADFGPYGADRDRRVGAALAQAGIGLVTVGSPYAVAPGTLLTAGGTPFQVFSPFARAWRARRWDPPLPRPRLGAIDRAGLEDDRGGGPRHPAAADLPEAGEKAAHRRLDAFIRSAAAGYERQRDRIDRATTSRLSPYLRFGVLHPRQVLARLEPGDAGHDRFATELCWREFHADVLHHRPDAARRAYRREWGRFEVDRGGDADERFEAWAEGRTGYPVVDAGMRQLRAEGWMPNRVRMIVASFLVKDLHLDWQRGARWFMHHLVDGDVASNQLNWQWVAGSGTDAAPYFRVFNPVVQGRRFDPGGDYVRRWVAELAALPGDVHAPWEPLLAASTGYPPPIVEHSDERHEALARYRRLRTGGEPVTNPDI